MKISVKRKNKITGIILALIISVVAALSGINIFSDNEVSELYGKYTDFPICVTFLDVGQGDCQIISCDGHNILIDGGEEENSGKILSFLKNNGIEKLDCYILTHPHSDHIGAAADVLSAIPCEKVFTTYFSQFNIPTTNVYERTLDAIYECGAEPVLVEGGDSFSFGRLEIDVFAPVVEAEDYNDMSIVLKATYKDAAVLFTGDATKAVERQMLERNADLSADVIKIAHHGSSTSSSAEFIDKVHPEYAVISCGENNTYGHPHKEIIKLLRDKNIEMLRTDDNGTVYYFGDGYNMTMEASR